MKSFFCTKCDYFGQTESHSVPGDPHEKACPHRAIGTRNRHAALSKLVLLPGEKKKENVLRPREAVTCLCHKNKVAKRKLIRMGAEV